MEVGTCCGKNPRGAETGDLSPFLGISWPAVLRRWRVAKWPHGLEDLPTSALARDHLPRGSHAHQPPPSAAHGPRGPPGVLATAASPPRPRSRG
jgi:hypothetical protein